MNALTKAQAPPPTPPVRARGILTAENTGSAKRRSLGYSRFVSFMKFVLPAAAVMLIAIIVIWPQIRVADTRFSIGFARLKATETEDPNMVNARYVGTDRKNRPFSITADLAKDLLRNSAAIELEMPKADLAVENGTWLVLTANTGVYKQGESLLELEGMVNLFHDSGYEFKTKKLRIDLAAGVATSRTPVNGQGPFGHLRAEGFRLMDGGDTIFFDGKSRLVIYPGAAGEPK